MIMTLFDKRSVLVTVFTGLAVILTNSKLLAHQLKETTASITLHNNHINVTIETELSSLLQRLPEDTRTGLTTDRTPKAHLYWNILKKQIAESTKLRVNGKYQPLTLNHFPDLSVFTNEHRFIRIRFESDLLSEKPLSIGVQLPEELGPAIITFSEPKYQWTSPGQPASFNVANSLHRKKSPLKMD